MSDFTESEEFIFYLFLEEARGERKKFNNALFLFSFCSLSVFFFSLSLIYNQSNSLLLGRYCFRSPTLTSLGCPGGPRRAAWR